MCGETLMSPSLKTIFQAHCKITETTILTILTILIVPSPFGLISHSKMYVVKKNIYAERNSKNYGLYCIVLYIFIIVTCTNRSNDIINMFTILIVPSPFGLISHSKMYVVKKNIYAERNSKNQHYYTIL